QSRMTMIRTAFRIDSRFFFDAVHRSMLQSRQRSWLNGDVRTSLVEYCSPLRGGDERTIDRVRLGGTRRDRQRTVRRGRIGCDGPGGRGVAVGVRAAAGRSEGLVGNRRPAARGTGAASAVRVGRREVFNQSRRSAV